jgi:hypothetical protein
MEHLNPNKRSNNGGTSKEYPSRIAALKALLKHAENYTDTAIEDET